MTHLFSPKGLRHLRRLLESPTLLAFDYDGTLAGLTPRPADAHLSHRVTQLIRALDAVTPVAIITGRARNDLHSLLSFRPRFTVGNHGLEGTGLSAAFLTERRRICRGWRQQIYADLGLRSKKHLDGTEKVGLEDKRFSITFHYRGATDREAAKRELTRLARSLTPSPRIVHGKAVINLIPRRSPHKGDALRTLLRQAHLKQALYVGDDVTDEDVFRFSGPRWLCVRVNRKRGSKAPFFLNHRSEVVTLLSLVRRIVLKANWVRDEDLLTKRNRIRS